MAADSRARLELVYREAAYRVAASLDQPAFVIRCGRDSSEVDQLLARHGLQSWAYLTACNPRSRILPAAENAARMAQLETAIRDRGHPWLPGSGGGDKSDWPAEPSLLVLGIPETEAVRLAAEFDQHAILVGRRGEPTRLVWTSSSSARS